MTAEGWNSGGRRDSRHGLGKQIPAVTNTHATTEHLSEAVFSVQSMARIYIKNQEKSASSEFPDSITVRRQKNMVVGPTGPGTKNDCALEGQQQFT